MYRIAISAVNDKEAGEDSSSIDFSAGDAQEGLACCQESSLLENLSSFRLRGVKRRSGGSDTCQYSGSHFTLVTSSNPLRG